MELSDRPLEAELAEIAERAEPGRTAQLAVRHWGWDGRGGATLEVTGRELGEHHPRAGAPALRPAGATAARGAGAAPALDRALVLAAHAAPTHGARPGPAPRRRAHRRAAVRPGGPAHGGRRPRPRRDLQPRDGQGRRAWYCPTRRTRRATRSPSSPPSSTRPAPSCAGRARPASEKSRAGSPRTSPCGSTTSSSLRSSPNPTTSCGSSGAPAGSSFRRSPRTPWLRASPRCSASPARCCSTTCTPASAATSACASS